MRRRPMQYHLHTREVVHVGTSPEKPGVSRSNRARRRGDEMATLFRQIVGRLQKSCDQPEWGRMVVANARCRRLRDDRRSEFQPWKKVPVGSRCAARGGVACRTVRC